MIVLNHHEWMLHFGDELADAITATGGMENSTVWPMLLDLDRCHSTGPQRSAARELLKRKLAARGMDHIFKEMG